jgi:hypothetical protein
MKMALIQEPVKIMITDSDTLLLHSRIMMLRSQRYEFMEKDVETIRRQKMDLEFQYKHAALALESAELRADQLLNEEKDYVNEFFTKARVSTPEMKTLQERYGNGVKFIFDSDAQEVWIVGVFSSDAPPSIHEEEDYSGEHYESIDDDEEHQEN